MKSLQFILVGPWSLRRTVRWGAVLFALLGALIISARAINFSPLELLRGLPNIADFIGRMVPVNWSFMDRLVNPVLETLALALWGTLVSLLLALPLCFLGAKNLSPHPAVFHLTRQFFNVIRGINEIIFGLIFVTAVGLGPASGVLALGIHGAGMLGKFFAEAIEEVDAGPVNALRATGANALQTIAFGVLPQALPSWIAATLYRLETNLRAATILGMVGAGGIGYELMASVKLFQYQDTALCVLVILAMVMSADYLSTYLRDRILR